MTTRSRFALASLALAISTCVFFGGCGSEQDARRATDAATSQHARDESEGTAARDEPAAPAIDAPGATADPPDPPDPPDPADPADGPWRPSGEIVDPPHFPSAIADPGSTPRIDELDVRPPSDVRPIDPPEFPIVEHGPAEIVIHPDIPTGAEPVGPLQHNPPVSPAPREAIGPAGPRAPESTSTVRPPTAVKSFTANPLRRPLRAMRTPDAPDVPDARPKFSPRSLESQPPESITRQPQRLGPSTDRPMIAEQPLVPRTAVPLDTARLQPAPPASPPFYPPVGDELPPPIEQPPRAKTTLRLVPPDARPPEIASSTAEMAPVETAASSTAAPATVDPRATAMEETAATNHPLVGDEPTDQPPAVDEPFHRVTVFYGTDRAGLSEMQRSQRPYLSWLKWSGISFAALFGIALLNLRRQAAWGSRTLLAVAVLATGGLSAQTVVTWLQHVPSDEQPQFVYGGERGELKFGTCEVSIPKRHEVGQVESPSLVRLEFRADPEKHVKVLVTEEVPEQVFYGQLHERVAASGKSQAFVFIHGYNVSFDDAVRRTGQLAFDLKFDGAPICYSWPSQAEYLGYSTDEDNVIWTESDLQRFLLGVKANSGAERIHLVAHSMGNRALTAVLQSLARDMEAHEPLFDEVVLTAPDVDADHFRRDLAPAIVQTARRVTLYASSNDEALAMSKRLHGGHPRAGESGENILVLPGIDTIDVSQVDTSLVGHSYYGDNTTVLADLFHLIHFARAPEQRGWLAPQPFDDMRYWVFLTDRIGERELPDRR